MPANTTPDRADLHEALYLKLTALAAHAQAMASRRGDGDVPAPVRRLAEDLLFALIPFVGRARRRNRLPAAAPGYAGLAAQLGEALAGLDAWEARHSEWSPKLNAFVWRVPGQPLPIRRLRPETAAVPERKPGQLSDIHRKLIARIEALRDAHQRALQAVPQQYDTDRDG